MSEEIERIKQFIRSKEVMDYLMKENQPEAVIETLVVPEGVSPEPWPIVAEPEDILL